MLLIGWKKSVATISDLFHVTNKVQQGQLNVLVEVRCNGRIGALANAWNIATHNLRRSLMGISQNSTLVDSAASYLLSSSREMSDASSHISLKSGSIAAAAEEVSTNIASISENIHSVSAKGVTIAAGTKNMSDRINAVSASIEEMSHSIEDVARNCREAQVSSTTARQLGDITQQKAAELEKAVEQIEEVSSLLNEITEQTKLLALNATIEAARAGDAGRGFSVVAKEVKELAGEAAQATDSIQASVRAIYGRTKEMVQLIRDISGHNQKLNGINTSIASATEQQSAVANEIARNVNETATNAETISSNVENLTTIIHEEIAVSIDEASRGVADLSSGIQQMNDKIREASSAAAGNYAFANDISRVTSDLKLNIHKFDIGMENFDIGKVKAAHLAWKTKLEGMLNWGMELSLHKIPNHTQCDFGKWIASPEGQDLRSEASFMQMLELHEKVHDLAYSIVDLHQNGRQQEAKKTMDHFEQARMELFASLDSMYRLT